MNDAASPADDVASALDAADANVRWRLLLHLGRPGCLTSDRVSFLLPRRWIVALATKK
jgi:hypothetical protein